MAAIRAVSLFAFTAKRASSAIAEVRVAEAAAVKAARMEAARVRETLKGKKPEKRSTRSRK